MPSDFFLKIDGVSGESHDSQHKGAIDVLAWSWGESSSAPPAGAGGGGGKANIQDLSYTANVSAATPVLVQACAAGKRFASAVLTARKPGGTSNGFDYLTFSMTDVAVTSVQEGGSGGEDTLTENVTLAFRAFHLQYLPQTAKGSAGTPVQAGWDVGTNQPA
jgi:type VI secretion system secreted protein Hcp